MTLAGARRAWHVGDVRSALRETALAWDGHPCAATREVLLALDRKLVDEEGPLSAHNPARRTTLWDDVESQADPADNGRLARLIVQLTHYDAHHRLGRLLDRGPDPRIHETLVDAMAARPRGFCAKLAVQTFWSRLLQDIHATAVPGRRLLLERARTSARTGPAAFRGPLVRELEGILADLGADPILQDSAAAVRLRADLVPSAAVAPLWDAVYADLSDPRPRHVLADALSEAGDPRGSFFALQLLPSRSPEQNRRMKALQKTHQDDWLGPLAPFLTRAVTFRNGLPTAGKLKDRTVSGTMCGHREWRSFEALDLGDAGHDGLFDQPWPVLRVLARAPAKVLDHGPNLPALRELSLTSAHEGWTTLPWHAPLFGQLERLEVPAEGWLPHVARVPAGFELVLKHRWIGHLLVDAHRTSITVHPRRPLKPGESLLFEMDTGALPLPLVWSKSRLPPRTA